MIEVDGGRYHASRFRRGLDARKQAIVEAAGYRVLRLNEDDGLPAREAQVVDRIWHALSSSHPTPIGAPDLRALA